eukprot:9738500-Ditylum_brightwellii.AAC.2
MAREVESSVAHLQGKVKEEEDKLMHFKNVREVEISHIVYGFGNASSSRFGSSFTNKLDIKYRYGV